MDRWLSNLYERDRAQYVTRVPLCLLLGIMVLIAPLGGFFPDRYEGLSVSQYLAHLGVLEASVFVMVASGTLVVRRDIRALTAWTRDRRDDLAPAARDAAFMGPRRFAVGLAVVAAVVMPVDVVPIAVPSHHTELLDWVELLIGGAVAGSIGVLNLWFDLEVLARPIRAELRGPGPDARRSSLIARLALIVPASTWVACFTFGYLSTTRARAGAGHLLVIYAFAFGGMAVSLLALAPLLQGGVFAPIRDLARATRAVASGRLDARAPVTATDELGELATSFNRMMDELTSTRARIVTASDNARRSVERDLHDGAQQQLVLLKLKLGLLKRDPGRTELIDEITAELQAALDELRNLARGIYPARLESDGLRGALTDAVERSALPATLDCDGIARYGTDIEAAVYFCCLEALQNAAKHAGDQAKATVSLTTGDHTLRFEVADDGRGFDPQDAHASAGLQNMRDRIAALGGTLDVHSRPGAGTTISGAVPV
jgi:signal transduction histidine kinase